MNARRPKKPPAYMKAAAMPATRKSVMPASRKRPKTMAAPPPGKGGLLE